MAPVRKRILSNISNVLDRNIKTEAYIKAEPNVKIDATGNTESNRAFDSLNSTADELQLPSTLRCGQSFRWTLQPNGIWISVLSNRIIELKQINGDVFFRDATEHASNLHLVRSELCDYFQLGTRLGELYDGWSAADPHFKSKASDPKWRGIRILRQDPVENVLSFICSSNNNIARISKMVQSMCSEWGNRLRHVDSGETYYAFPTIPQLAKHLGTMESTLRRLGFGYRAKYITATVRYLADDQRGRDWLLQLRDLAYDDAKQKLLELMGVGPKVADCICLMSLDKTGAIPVDTHVWQIAKRDYKVKGLNSQKSLNPKTYELIGRHFRDLHGPFAGWAHSVLFASDLSFLKNQNL